MIDHNTSYAPSIHPRLAMLHRNYRDLTLRLCEASEDLPTVATYIPSSGKGIAFDRPIAPVGSALLCTFDCYADPDDREGDPCFYFTGYRARYLHRAVELTWESEPWFHFPVGMETYASVYDERLMRSPKLLDTLIGLGQLAQRMRHHEPMDYWRLTQPPTLLGFDPQEPDLIERLIAQPTRSVLMHERENGLTTEQAWQELDGATRVDGDIEMTGLRLVDSRLCADVETGTGHLPQVLTSFHDLRPILGRRCSNPSRKLMDDEYTEMMDLIDVKGEPRRATRRLRRIMLREIADGCTDCDLRAAIREPEGPLVASRIAKRQAWRAS